MFAFRFLLGAVTLILATTCLASEELSVSLQFDSEHAEPDSQARIFKLRYGETVVVRDLELGDSVEAALVTIAGAPGSSKCNIQAQYETSVTIMNEGPHVDLRDWKHFTSPWLDAKKLKRLQYRLPEISEADSSQFPELVPGELFQAVLEEAGQPWADLVRGVVDPRDYPAAVGISTYRVRVRCPGQPNSAIEFLIAMGC